MPWLKGDKKVLGFGALTTNCLCRPHNSSLSPIDAAGALFFEAIQKCGTNDTGPNQHFLLSGHDIERWMLRTLAAFGHSKNLGIDGARIDNEFVERLQLAELLEQPTHWKRPQGMYLTQGLNHRFTRKDNFELSPLLKRGSDEVVGMIFDIQGFNLALLAASHEVEGSFLQNTSYRPGSFIFKNGRFTHDILLSWEDDVQHSDVTLIWEP